MKKNAKLITLILAVSVIFGAFGVTAHADGKATVTVDSAQASPGDTVSVDVSISDCAQFSSYTVHVDYDSEYVTAVEAKKVMGMSLYMPNLTVGGKKELAIVGGDVNNVTKNGVIATLVFKISDDYPGGITEVPLKVVTCKLTEFNGKTDVAIASQSVSGKIVISGAGNVVWNGDGGATEITPSKLTDEQAAEYKNPLSGGSVTGGDYYVNEESKIAIPAADVENGVKNDPETWKTVEEDVEPDDTPASSSETADQAQGSEPSGEAGGKLNWLLIGCIAGGAAVVIAGVIAFIAIMKKKNKTEQE